jgi:hypothetical protein
VLLAELSVRAAVLSPVPAELEVERCQLELARIARASAGARGAGRGGVTALQREREALKQELERWLAEALEQTDQPSRLTTAARPPRRARGAESARRPPPGARARLVWSNCRAEVEAGVADLPGWPIPG